MGVVIDASAVFSSKKDMDTYDRSRKQVKDKGGRWSHETEIVLQGKRRKLHDNVQEARNRQHV